MSKSKLTDLIGSLVESDPDRRHPSLTPDWLRSAIRSGRDAFEQEMRRERKQLDEEFERFWRESTAREG